MQLKSSTWVVQVADSRLGEQSICCLTMQVLYSNSCLSVRMSIFLLGLSKHSTIWYQTRRRNKGISALPRPTFGFFSLAFTKQHIIEQKFQSMLLRLISTPLSSLSASEDVSCHVNICAKPILPTHFSGDSFTHEIFFGLQH